MKSSLQILALGTAVVLGATSLSVAQGQNGGMQPGFEDLDANGDGRIELSEMKQMPMRMFLQADTDGDGKVGRDELIVRMQAQVERRVDGMLARLDTDKDGAISEDEMRQGREKMKERHGKNERHGKKDRKQRGDWMERMFDRADTNDDGALDRAEFDAARERMGRKGGTGQGQQDAAE